MRWPRAGCSIFLKQKDRYGVWHSTQATINVHDTLRESRQRGRQRPRRLGRNLRQRPSRGRARPAARESGHRPARVRPHALRLRGRQPRRSQAGVAGSALAHAQAQAVTTYYLPWAKALAGDEGAAPNTTTQGGSANTGRAGPREERRREFAPALHLIRPNLGGDKSGGHLQRAGRARGPQGLRDVARGGRAAARR